MGCAGGWVRLDNTERVRPRRNARHRSDSLMTPGGGRLTTPNAPHTTPVTHRGEFPGRNRAGGCVLLGDAVSAEGASLHTLQAVASVLGVPSEPEAEERLEQLVSRVFCGEHEAVAGTERRQAAPAARSSFTVDVRRVRCVV